MKNIKNNFPILKNNSNLIYLDSAATTQKPQVVIDAVKDFYEKENANIHRGIYDLSSKATAHFEQVREQIAHFIGAKSTDEIIFTSGATESINLVATGWAKKFLHKGDIVVLSEMEHNSNIVPWLQLRKEIGIELFFLPINEDGRLGYSVISTNNVRRDPQKISRHFIPRNDIKRIKLIALTHASNVLGTVNPLDTIIPYFRKHVPEAKILIDAAQSIAHLPIHVMKLDADFLVFSSHKLYGPSGVGVLWGKKDLLETMNPPHVGSHMIKKVTKEKAIWAGLPDRFESGTRNLEGVIGLGAAIAYLQTIGMENIFRHEQEVTIYALEKFQTNKNLQLFGPTTSEHRLGIFSFSMQNIHPHDIAEILNRSGIAVRSGHHCAHILIEKLGVSATTRASLGIYNTKDDIDRLMEGIEEVRKVFKIQ